MSGKVKKKKHQCGFVTNSPSFLCLEAQFFSESAEVDFVEPGPVFLFDSRTQFGGVGSRLPEPEEQREEQNELCHRRLDADVHQTQHGAERKKSFFLRRHKEDQNTLMITQDLKNN